MQQCRPSSHWHNHIPSQFAVANVCSPSKSALSPGKILRKYACGTSLPGLQRRSLRRLCPQTSGPSGRRCSAVRHALHPLALHSIGTLTFRSSALHARHALRSAGGGFLIVCFSFLIVIHPMVYALTVFCDLRPTAPMRAVVPHSLCDLRPVLLLQADWCNHWRAHCHAAVQMQASAARITVRELRALRRCCSKTAVPLRGMSKPRQQRKQLGILSALPARRRSEQIADLILKRCSVISLWRASTTYLVPTQRHRQASPCVITRSGL